MKKTNHILTLISALGMVALMSSCNKEPEIYQPENRDFSNKAFLKVYNSTVNSTRNYVYLDNVPLTGAGLIFTTAPLFPQVSHAAAVDAGARSVLIKDTLVTTTQKPLTFTTTFDAGSSYTILTYDTITNPKYLVVKDLLTQPDDTTSRLRFANLVYNRVAVPNVDIYSIKLKQNIFTNVATERVSDFIPYQSGLADTLFVRTTGTTTNLAQLNNFNPTQKRSYTIVFRGHYPTTTGTLARSLTQFVNY